MTSVACGVGQLDLKSIYQDHGRFVRQSLRRRGVPASYLDDAVQDVLVVVFRNMPDSVPKAEVVHWLSRVCTRTAKDHRRRAHVRREVLHPRPGSRIAETGPALDDLLDQHESADLISVALAALDANQRAVFLLFELEELTGDEIAVQLRIPLGTVYERLRRARESLARASRAMVARGQALPPEPR